MDIEPRGDDPRFVEAAIKLDYNLARTVVIDNFELVVNSRWPTIQDIHLPRWGRNMLRSLSLWRYALGVYKFPFELQWAQRLVSLRKPRLESL